jgi:APA family basic amino acid/polyamine antiporter
MSKPSLGFWRCWSLVVGGTIGSGIFMIPAVLAPYGGLGLLSLAMATFGALAVALTFASLARRVTTTGGFYAYTRTGMGAFAGFLVAWSGWIGLWVSAAAIAITLASYLGVLVPVIGGNAWLSALAGLSVIWIIVGINIAGVKETSVVSLITTVLKLLPLLLIAVAGLWFVDASILLPLNPAGGNALLVFASVFTIAFWNFLGIESATVPAEDTQDPQHTIPKATVMGTLTVGLVYLLVCFVVLGIIPYGELASSSSPLSDVGERMFGTAGSLVVVVGALISTLGALNTVMLTTGQVAMAAARDGLFPGAFSRLSTRHTPALSYLLAGSLASALLILNFTRGLVAAYVFVILIATLTGVLTYAFSSISSLILQRKNPAVTSAQRFREALTATISFAICIWVIAASGPEAAYWSFLLLLAGLPLYALLTTHTPFDRQPAD